MKIGIYVVCHLHLGIFSLYATKFGIRRHALKEKGCIENPDPKSMLKLFTGNLPDTGY